VEAFVNWQHGQEFFLIVIITTKVVFCSTIITTGLKKSLNRLISQPEKDTDMQINMLSWNVSVTHDTKLQKEI
jgi:hypothetical protein